MTNHNNQLPLSYGFGELEQARLEAELAQRAAEQVGLINRVRGVARGIGNKMCAFLGELEAATNPEALGPYFAKPSEPAAEVVPSKEFSKLRRTPDSETVDQPSSGL